MAKQTINVGTDELSGDGESLRSAFIKVNSNFTELYSAGTGTVGFTGSAGTIGYTGSAGSTGFTGSQGSIGYTGSAGASIDLTTVTSHILPAADLTYDLGSTSSQWRSLYVGTSTIYIGGKALSITPAGAITVDGSPVSSGGAANVGDLSFTATTITAPADSSIRIVSTDTIYNRALVDLDPVYGNVSLQAWSGENTRSDTNAWNTGTWTINPYGNPYMRFEGASDLVYWFTNTLQNSDPDTVSYSINGGEYIAWDGGSSSDPTTGFLEIYTSGVNPPGNTTTNITSLDWKYRFTSGIQVGFNNGLSLDSGDQYIGINAGSYIQMFAKGSIDISNSDASGSDIEINSGDDIWIRGKDKTSSDSEGGDINIEAGDGGNADLGDGGGTGGDVRIIAGRGGNAGSAYMGGVGGFIQVYSGDGGSANAANGQTSNNGGDLELQAGSAGFNDGNPAFGNAGGNLEIRAGNSNNYIDNGGNVIIQPGTNTAGTSTVAGYVRIQVPSSSGAAGGSWYFEGDGQTLRFPNGSTLGPEGMGAFGISNGTSGNPVHIVNKNAAGNYLADIILTAGDGISGEIAFQIWNTVTSSAKTINIDSFANLSVPGVIYNNDASNVGQLLLAGAPGEPATYLALPSDVGSTSMNVRLSNSNGGIQLYAGNNNWLFNNGGDIQLPRGGVITENSVTNEVFGTTTTSVTLIPPNGWDANMRLDIYPTEGGEGNHLHLTAGNQTSTDLYLGNDSQYVTIRGGGNIEVKARNGIDSSTPGTPAGSGSDLYLSAGRAGYVNDPGDGAAAGSVYVAAGESTTGTGGVVQIVSGYGPQGYGFVEISTDGNMSRWKFNKNNELEFPDNTIQTTAYRFVTPPVSSTSTGVTGALAKDSTYFYVCTGTNSWQRIAWDNTPW